MTTFHKQSWDTLNSVDCSAMVEKKGQLSYLSWANAWTSLMSVYPASRFAFLDDHRLPNDTVEVHVSVVVSDGESEIERDMFLPVMDYKNKAIINPDSRDISDARMRCLVKCIALFGLGLFLYRGEDIPQQREQAVKPLATKEQKEQLIEFRDQGFMSPRRMAWCKNVDNWHSLSSANANTIIDECELLKREKEELKDD